MHAKVILSILFMLSVSGGLLAQGVTLSTMPRTQAEGNPSTTYTISPTVTGNFSATIFLRASSPTLGGATFSFTPALLNYPYQLSSEMKVTATGARTGGDHRIIVEGYNGPLIVRDTVLLTITDRPAWRAFDMYNSPLPSNKVTCVAVDGDGVGWIGTDSGLVRFDGITWTVLKRDGLQASYNNDVTSIEVDATGGVWVGSADGLSEFRNGVWLDYKVTRGVDELAIGRNGVVWTAARSRIHRIEGTNIQKFDHDNSLLKVNPLKIVVDKDEVAWIIDNYGIDKFDGTFWTHIPVSDLYPKGNGRLSNVDTDRNGDVWVTSNFGIIRFDGAQHTVLTNIAKSYAGDLCFDSTGTIWIPGGIDYHIDPRGLGRSFGTEWWFYTTSNSGLPSNYIADIEADRNNTIWIATDKGLALLDGNAAPMIAFTSVEDDTVKPLMPLITSIAPHPVSGVSTIRLDLVESSHVRLALHNSRGQEVVVLCDRMLDKGERLIQIDATTVPVGVYVLRLVAGDVVESRALIVSR